MWESAVKILILLTPPFVLSVFLSMTDGETPARRRSVAVRSSLAILTASLLIYALGNLILRSLGITLDAFRIGAGLVLLLSGIEMVRGTGSIRHEPRGDSDDIAIVPLAIPCAIGPGTAGALMMMGGNAFAEKLRMMHDFAAIVFCSFVMLAILLSAELWERLLGRRGISVLSKLTGLFLAALASQIIFDGIRGMLKLG